MQCRQRTANDLSRQHPHRRRSQSAPGAAQTERRITLTSLAAHDARYLEDVVDELKATQAAYVTRTVIELT